MNRKRSLCLLALLPVLGLIWAMRSAASWRPQLFAVQPDPNYRNFSVLTFSPDGKLLAVGNSEDAQLWDVGTQRILWKNQGAWPIFSPDSRTVVLEHPTVVGAEMRKLAGERFELHDARTGRLLHVLSDPRIKQQDDLGGDVLDCAFSPDGREFRVATSLWLWRFDTHSGRLLQLRRWPLRGSDKITGLGSGVFASDGTFAGWGEDDGSYAAGDSRSNHLTFFEPRAMHQLRNYSHPFSGGTMQIASDSLTFIDGDQEGYHSAVFRVRDGKRIAPLPGTDPQFSRDGTRVYAISTHGCLIYDAHTGHKLNILSGPLSENFTPSPDDNWLYEARGGKIYYWRAR